MTIENTPSVLLGIIVTSLCLLLWVVSIGFVSRGLHRRNVSGPERIAWLALVICLPGLGFLAYLFSRLLDFVFSPGAALERGGRKRSTMLKQSPGSEQRTDTILGADLVKKTILDPKQAQEADEDSGLHLSALLFIVTEGPHVEERFVVEAFPISIGRGGDAAIRLEKDLGVSRRHAEIYQGAGSLRIRDLGSTHGTQVNGRQIDDSALMPDDTINVGVSKLLVRGTQK